MKKVIFKADFGDHEKTVEISQVSGSGGSASFHVYLDRYYIANIFMTELYGWRWHTPEKAELQSGDIYALIEIIEREWGL